MNRILFYGHKGWIGTQVLEILNNMVPKKVEKVILGNARADDIENLRDEIDKIAPTHVMAFIGRTHGIIGDKVYRTIDYLEQPDKLVENMRDNLFSPLSLAILCQERGIHFTYMGTGCIYSHSVEYLQDNLSNSENAEEDKGFNEEDLPNFFSSSYSTVKGYTDRLMHFFENTVLNVRIRMPITGTDNNRNFITKIVNYDKICSIPNSMTVLPNLLPIMVDMALNKETGTINLVNPGLISHNEILSLYKDIVDPSFTWKNFTLEEQSLVLAAGRSNNLLDTSKLVQKYPSVLPIKKAVISCLMELAKTRN